MDEAINQGIATWTRKHARVPTAPAPQPDADPMAGRKLPTPPPWWHGGQDATRSSLIAAQQLRPGGTPAKPKPRDEVADLEEDLGIGTHDDIQAELDQIDGS